MIEAAGTGAIQTQNKAAEMRPGLAYDRIAQKSVSFVLWLLYAYRSEV